MLASSAPALVHPEPRSVPSAADVIERTVKSFRLTADPNDIHGSTVQDQLLSSYIQWLEMERRLASTALWPQMPEGLTPPDKKGAVYACIPANTRWGDWHYSNFNFPAMKWVDRPHPVTRAALVLWAVGAIDDIPDPLRDLFAAYTEAMTADLSDDSDETADEHQTNVIEPIRERIQSTTLAPTTMSGAAELLRFVLRDVDGAFQASDVEIAAIDAVIRFLEREEPQVPEDEPRPTPRPKDDPAFASIDWHRDLWAKWMSFGDGTPDDDPAFKKADRAEINAWDMLITVVPTTLPGLTAWSAYLGSDPHKSRIEQAGDTETVIATLNKSLAFLSQQGGQPCEVKALVP